MSIDWSEKTNDELIELLANAGMDVPKGLPEAIIDRGESVVEPLCEMLLDERNRAEGATEEQAWSRNHAFILLGLIGSPKAAPALLDYFRLELPWDDMVVEDGEQVLGRLGPEAINFIITYIGERERDPLLRGVAADGLVNIGYFHPKAREPIAAFFRNALADADEENDPELTDGLVSAAACIDDPNVQEQIDLAFERDAVDYSMIDEDDVERIRAFETPWSGNRPESDLMYYFSEKFFAMCRAQKEKDRAWREKKTDSNNKPHLVSQGTDPYRRETPKIGRNDPCHCGSGKKYKKCCLDRDEAARRESIMLEPYTHVQPINPEAESFGESLNDLRIPAISPYAIARALERDDPIPYFTEEDAARIKSVWTPGKLEAMSTDEIKDRLRAIGVDPSREAFLELSRDQTSAWVLSDVWRNEVGPLTDRDDDDFLGLSACELWKRLCPGRPSMEMLDDWMQDGYEQAERNESGRACEIWMKVWDVLHARFTPEMRTLEDAEIVFHGSQSLLNWAQDFETELLNASRHDSRFAEMGMRYIREFLKQFAGEDLNLHLHFRAGLASHHFRMGLREEGERLYLEMIEDAPDQAHGYVNFADELSWRDEKDESSRDIDRAISLLETALARPVEEAESWDIEFRLDDLRRKKATLAAEKSK